MFQGFSHFQDFLHHFVLAKLLTSSIRVIAIILVLFQVFQWSVPPPALLVSTVQRALSWVLPTLALRVRLDQPPITPAWRTVPSVPQVRTARHPVYPALPNPAMLATTVPVAPSQPHPGMIG